MRKRDLVRHVPGFATLVRALEDVERRNEQLVADNQQLKRALHEAVFSGKTLSVAQENETEHNGVPIPPPALRFMVAATDDLDWFLRSGELGARSLVDTLANRAPALGEFKTILDFGCGCARVLRHVKGMTPAALHGSDCNARAIEWCKENLKFATFTVNALEPPLTYPDGMFDLIYVFSILTHLTEPLQQQWMAELRRVLAPGGYLALSLHGEKAAEALSADDHARFKSGAMVVREAEVVGTNYCSSYHPESYVRKVLARGFEIIDLVPEGAKGCPPQDLYLMRRSDQA